MTSDQLGLRHDTLLENIRLAFRRSVELDDLCGQILATLAVNLKRGNLHVVDDHGNKNFKAHSDFEALVTKWQESYAKS